MILWCIELSRRLENTGIKNEMMPRFVDDITLCPKIIPPGWKYNKGSLIYLEDCVEEDKCESGDKRTMNIIKEIADEIFDNIKVTFDIPSNYCDKKIPILDLKAGLDEDGLVKFEFYRKPVTNNMVMLKDSAYSVQ